MILHQLEAKLKGLGVKKDDLLFVSSDITSFSVPDEAKDIVNNGGINTLLDSYIDTFEEVVGKNGLVIMPTYSYSIFKKEIYDPKISPSTVGALGEYFRKRSKVIRSLHPVFSIAVLGNGAKVFLRLFSFDIYGENSFFRIFRKLGGKYLMFGIGMQGSATFVYHAEQETKVPYRFFKDFHGFIREKSGTKEVKIRYFVRRLDSKRREIYKDWWYNAEKIALKKGIMKRIIYSGSSIYLTDAESIHKLLISCLKVDRYFLVKKAKYK